MSQEEARNGGMVADAVAQREGNPHPALPQGGGEAEPANASTANEAGGEGALTVPPPPKAGEVPVLQKLSSPPFPRSGFPLLGILASVYEHVISVAGRGAAPGEPTGNTAVEQPQSPHNTSQ